MFIQTLPYIQQREAPLESPMIELDQLLASIRAHESSALQRLYDHFGPQVYSLAYAVVQNREAAEEITQDVFLKVWHRLEQYESGTNFRAWLLQMTRNQAIDHIRREKKHNERSAIWNMDDLRGPSNLLDDDARWIRRALRTLSDPQRDAIELAFLQGMTHQQIAERLDAPLGTVKTRIRDGLQRLREAWESENVP
jgi:RNA polymerase sigma-70 factor (ECF subfamily)